MPVAGRLTLRELRRRANAGLLTQRELSAIFLVDDAASRPFAPILKLDSGKVDLEGAKPDPGEIATLLARAQKPRRRMPAGAEAAAGKIKPVLPISKPKKTLVLAEGDSWFHLPNLVYPRDIVDWLKETHDVVSVSLWGAELQEMFKAKQYLQKLKARFYRHFLLSGGGNDVLGSIADYVLRCDPGDADPANAAKYVKPEFVAKVGEIVDVIATIAAETRKVSPGTILYVHGYADAVPVAGKKYLGKPLAELGFDPGSALAKAVVAELIGRFNRALARFAQNTGNVAYTDFRGAIGAGDWNWDEIHPSADGSRKAAKLLALKIAANGVGV